MSDEQLKEAEPQACDHEFEDGDACGFGIQDETLFTQRCKKCGFVPGMETARFAWRSFVLCVFGVPLIFIAFLLLCIFILTL